MPSELEKQKARKEALLQQAITSHNEGVQEYKRDRRNARIEMQGLIREQRAAHAKWQKEQQRQADEGGWLAGAMQGGSAGMSIGTAVKPGLGTLIGGLAGAIGGGIYGGVAGGAAVSAAAPYVGAASQMAMGYAGMREGRERNKAMMDFYKGQDMRPGSTAGGAYPGGAPMSLGRSDLQFKPLDVPNQFDFSNSQVDYATERRGGLLPEDMTAGAGMLEARKGRSFYDLMNPPTGL